jgi:outer membrane receptor protein involved in Fe transport
MRSISIRGSWAKLFRPPNISQVVETNNFSEIVILPDAQASSGTTAALIDSGNNSQLRQERSTNWAVTLEFKPPANPNFGASLNYFHIDSRDRIEDLLFQIPQSDGRTTPGDLQSWRFRRIPNCLLVEPDRSDRGPENTQYRNPHDQRIGLECGLHVAISLR